MATVTEGGDRRNGKHGARRTLADRVDVPAAKAAAAKLPAPVKSKAILERERAAEEERRRAEAQARIDQMRALRIATWTPIFLPPIESFLGDEEPDDDDSEDWILRDLVPRGEVGVIAGPPKSGKTWAMLDMAIAIAMGQQWCERENTLRRPGRVLVVGLEDSRRRLRKRVWQLARGRGTSPNHPTFREHFRITDSRETRFPSRVSEFADTLAEWKPDAIFLDNVQRTMAGGDQNDAKETGEYMDALSAIARQTGAAVIALHHMAKGLKYAPELTAADVADKIRGSSEFLGGARHSLIMLPLELPPAEGQVLEAGLSVSALYARGNLTVRQDRSALGMLATQDRDERISVVWRAEGMPDDVARNAARARAKLDDSATWTRVRDVLLVTDAMSRSEIGDAIGVADRTLDRHLSRWHERGLLTRTAPTKVHRWPRWSLREREAPQA